MNHDYLTRPKDVLDTWTEQYDYKGTPKPSTSENILVYALWRERQTDGEYRNKWSIMGAAHDPAEAFKEAFKDCLTKYKNARELEMGNNTPRLLSLLVLNYGTGKWGIGNGGADDFTNWSKMTEAEKQVVRDADPEFVRHLEQGEMVCRLVNLITPTGLLAEVTMFHAEGAPHVEVLEQWLEDGENTIPESKGNIDDVLMNSYAFLQLIEASAVNNAELGITGLLETALSMAREGDNKMVGFLLRIVATGLEGGVLDIGED